QRMAMRPERARGKSLSSRASTAAAAAAMRVPPSTPCSAMVRRSTSRICAADRICMLLLLLFHQIFQQEQQIGGPLRQPAHEIGVPLRAKRNVYPHPPALAAQLFLQIAPDAVQHLKL